jgi:hypothetical protein
MGLGMGKQDFILALGHARATFVAQVGSGSTTTQINLAGLNLGNANLTGNLVLLDAGALGAGSLPTIATISGNTATSLTVSALPTAPVAGSNLWIFTVATIQANVAENIAQVGGQAVPTDGQGTAMLPVEAVRDVVPLTSITNQAANANFASFTAPYAGTARILIGLATASVLNLAATPIGGSQSVWAMNSGQMLSAGQLYAFEFPISKGAQYALQVGTAQSGTLIVSVEAVLT